MDTSTRIGVSGGAGFLGRAVVEELRRKGYAHVVVPRSASYDLVREPEVERFYDEQRPQVLIHLAAVVGGIGANRRHPGEFFYRNLMMGALLMEHGRRHGLEKFVAVGTVCAYPKHTPVPFREEDLWNGYPEETNAPYGIAKKMLLVQAQAYRAEYGFNAIYLLPVNLFGPGDNFDPATSHVIPALIEKCFKAVESGQQRITVWGDGSASREFLYVDDCAQAIVLALERYDGSEPMNLGVGLEITIRDLARKVARAVGFQGEFVWDTNQPNGQPRRCLDVSRARRELGWSATVSLDEGLARTVEWYRSHRTRASNNP